MSQHIERTRCLRCHLLLTLWIALFAVASGLYLQSKLTDSTVSFKKQQVWSFYLKNWNFKGVKCHLTDRQRACSFSAGLPRGGLPPSLPHVCPSLSFVLCPGTFWAGQNHLFVKGIQAPVLSWEAEGKTKEWLVSHKPKFSLGTSCGHSFSILCLPTAGTTVYQPWALQILHPQASAAISTK